MHQEPDMGFDPESHHFLIPDELFFLKILFIYFYLRERESMRVSGEGHKGREKEKESEADSILTREPYLGLNLMTMRS